MTEQTFEDKFPELEDEGCKLINLLSAIKGKELGNEIEEYLVKQVERAFLQDTIFTEGQIEKHCLSKQRVIEAIEQVSSHGDGCRCPVLMNSFAKKQLLQILELEE